MISVIIPTLNEQEMIAATLTNLLSQKGNYEVIIVDGGSKDETIQIIKRFEGIRLVNSKRGRAIQMNNGAKRAKGDILLFLHADTQLSEDAIPAIERNMADLSIGSGSFFIKFDRNDYLLRLYSFLSKINHPLFTYGDQAIIIRKKVFEDLKGFKEIPIMEDVEIQKRLRRRGKFIKINMPVITSSRRFIKNGIIKQQIRNIILVALYKSGISLHSLKRYYDGK